MDILQKIINTKHTEVTALNKTELLHIATNVSRPVVSFSGSLQNSTNGIITEFKRQSPSKGVINSNADIASVVAGYELSGAAAISVLTDTSYFGGSLQDLAAARNATKLPLLRKDFIIDNSQICEARIYGADVILLIASVLTPEQTVQLAQFAQSLSLEVLLEIHGEHELDHINKWVNVVGVNNRNLSTFQTSIEKSLDLANKIPNKYIRISESGISTIDTLHQLQNAGYKGFLMGENFMKTVDPASAAAEFIKNI